MRSFALRKRESPNDMYWRLQALVGTMKRYGCKREVTDSYVVRKILCAMAPRYPTVVSTVCERPDFEELTPRGVIDSFIFYDMLQESSGRITGGSATTKVDDTARETAPPALTYGDSEYCFGSSGETPHFDDTHYLSWQRRMKLHLLSMNPLVWRIVETGHVVVDKANPTALEKRNEQYDANAMYALISALIRSEYSWVCYYESAKEIWDALRTFHEAVREPKLDSLRREMDLFALGKHETPNDMYTRLNNLANEMKGLGCKEMTDSYVVRKMLHVMTPRNSALVTLIREMPSFEQLTPQDVLATFLLYDMVQKEYKTVSYGSPSSSKISLKAKLVLAEEPSNEEHDQDQEMTLLLENFGRMLRQKEYEARRRITNFPDKSKMRKSKRYCYRCGEPDHLVANCPIQWT
uniref:Uncharacterized protein n=1 Tax=Avena sativa TaxID=4498 RepID=A0ACD5X048_AVESA